MFMQEASQENVANPCLFHADFMTYSEQFKQHNSEQFKQHNSVPV